MLKITTTQAEDLVARYVQPGLPLLSILHGVQAEVGYLPQTLIAPLARALNLSRAEVHGFITYYPHFRRTPAAPVAIQVCRAEACQSAGGEALVQHIERCTGQRFASHHAATEVDQLAGDGPAPAISLESVYCLGQCALSPALTINQRLHAKVSPEKFDTLLADAQASVAAARESL